MPFYMEEQAEDRNAPNQRKNSLLVVTLQVRILNHTGTAHGKKAFPSASASLTLEAALVVSLFIFAVVCLILPMKIMNTDRKLQAALESAGEEFSRYAYLKHALEHGNLELVPGAEEFAIEFCRYLSEGAAIGYSQVMVGNHVNSTAVTGLTLRRSSVSEDGTIFDLIADYEIRMPFPVLGLETIKRTIRCRRRAWIGLAGKDGGEGGAGGNDNDEIVYIGKNSTRYHKNRSCHYLANQLSAVAYEQVDEMRNESGGKYYPCRVCGAAGGQTVYLMPSGDRYHTSRMCTAILAYVRAVRLSEVEHLGPCSYCSG